MRIKDIDISNIINACKSFSYDVDGNPVNVTLYPDELNGIMYRMFNRSYGYKKADDIALDYKDGLVNASTVAAVIKQMSSQRWKHYLGAWQSEYNPIWNVDGTEERTIETKYGRITTLKKGSTITNTQLTDSETITEQLTNSTSTDYVAPYDSQSFNPAAKNETDAGKVKGTSRAGTTTSAGSGQDSNEDSGKDTVTDKLVKGGNIGVTMTQQLLTAELDLWKTMDFFNMWLKDIADVLTEPYWEV